MIKLITTLIEKGVNKNEKRKSWSWSLVVEEIRWIGRGGEG